MKLDPGFCACADQAGLGLELSGVSGDEDGGPRDHSLSRQLPCQIRRLIPAHLTSLDYLDDLYIFQLLNAIKIDHWWPVSSL